MRYQYHIDYDGHHEVADTAGQAAAILRVLDGGGDISLPVRTRPSRIPKR